MRRIRIVTAAAAGALLAGVLTAPAASAAGPTDCPEAFPTAEAVDGVTGTGYTVERGTTPDPFSATVLGRLTNGIAPGIDMIMADLDSPALTRAGGVWAGMSGSPVYAADGRLIGSVSYGLAASSSIAGITPASDMQKLLGTASTAAGRTKIAVSTTVAQRLARTGEVTAAQAASGFQRLKVPLSVSGATSSHYSKLLDGLRRRAPDAVIRTGGPTITDGAAGAASGIGAGGNFAAALSYGDLTLAGIGTTTFVCDAKAVAFGHPFLLAGAAQYSAHTADALFVQPDPIFGPFKVANPGGVVGVVDQDRVAGIRARLGATPSTFDVTTLLRRDGGEAVSGLTTGVYQPWAADIAALHLLISADRVLDAVGPGSAALTFTVSGTRNGVPFVLKRSDHYSDRFDIAFTATFALFDLIRPLLDQPFENVKITKVAVNGNLSSTVKEYRVSALKVRKSGVYVAHKGVLKVAAGKKVYLQYTLARYRSTQKVLVPLAISVPAGTKGNPGVLTAAAGASFNEGAAEPKSLSALLSALAKAPRNDSLRLNLAIQKGAKTVRSAASTTVGALVSEYTRDIDVAVTS